MHCWCAHSGELHSQNLLDGMCTHIHSMHWGSAHDAQAANGEAAALLEAQAELTRLQALLEGEPTTQRCLFLTHPLAGRLPP